MDEPAKHKPSPLLASVSAPEAPAARAAPPAPSREKETKERAAPVRDDDPERFLNRELTWLSFNSRVLHEALDERTPLLERVKFLAIASSNLDEFFMKRIGGLKQQVGAGVHNLTPDGRTPAQQIIDCAEVLTEMRQQKRKTYLALVESLRLKGIRLTTYDNLSDQDRATLRRQYLKNIFPLVTPLAMDPAHPFPFISNLSLNLLVSLHYPNDSNSILARVKVPIGAGVPRLLKVGDTLTYIPLEDVMADNLDLLFPDTEIETCELFRVTRNANTEADEEQAGDLLDMIETELRDRKFAPIVRLQIRKGMKPVHRGMLAAELGLDEENDVYETDVMIGMRDLMEIATLDIPELHDPDHHPINNVALQNSRSIFHIIRDTGSILLQHPYESFATSVERFVREASLDPKVLAIKVTLYRTSADTKIINQLIDAARNGKQVAVVVELKARFDEAANIRWASRLEEYGIHVTYGVVGLKTHSKLILVIRNDYYGLRRYAHIGTGNYHAGTARLYSDLGILTCDDDIGQDLTGLFNYLTTGCRPLRKYRKLLAAPVTMKKALLDKIDREIDGHTKRNPGLIRFKSNAIEDPDIVDALYRASRTGVKVELVIRDSCRLRPGLRGLSENITVTSIVGRFLEHTRIFYFRNGGEEEYYIGSADLMTRNLEHRVEVLTPVEPPELRRQLKEIFDLQLKDNRSGWDMLADGSYVQRKAGRTRNGSQQKLINAANKRDAEANRLKKRKLNSIARRASK